MRMLWLLNFFRNCVMRSVAKTLTSAAFSSPKAGSLSTLIVACSNAITGFKNYSILERETGIEPATNSLEGCDSTTELLPQRLKPLLLRISAARLKPCPPTKSDCTNLTAQSYKSLLQISGADDQD